jgi:single-strand DNA-binding protein
MNKAIIIGNLGQVPDIKAGKSGVSFGTLSVATNERRKNKEGEYEDHTEWHRVVVLGKTADACSKFLDKGSKVAVEGRIQTRKWEDKDGNDKYTTEIVADHVEFLNSKSDGKGASGGGGGRKSEEKGDEPFDDEIPF